MSPVKTIAVGLLVVVAGFRINGYDLLADPVGWVVVLSGLSQLPRSVRDNRPLGVLAAVSLAVSVPMWFLDARPDTPADEASAGDVLVATLVTLPETAFLAILCAGLAVLAADAGDVRSAGRLRTAGVLVWVTLALPTVSVVLLAAIGTIGFVLPALAGFVVYVYVLVLLFSSSGRPWAAPLPVG